MAEPKTRKTGASVTKYISGLKDKTRQRDSKTLVKLMKKITGERPAMWGPSIIGFGSVPIRDASGKELDWPLTGFSPRKQAMSIYLMCDMKPARAHLKKLGPHKKGKSCLYVKDLEQVDLKVLEKMIRDTVRTSKKAAK